jgi:hypothetical protein
MRVPHQSMLRAPSAMGVRFFRGVPKSSAGLRLYGPDIHWTRGRITSLLQGIN